MSKPVLLQGAISGKGFFALKDDGSNSNVTSWEFANRNSRLSKIRNKTAVFRNSSKNLAETTTEKVINGTVQTVRHGYFSNWIIADLRYDLILDMPWHTDVRPSENNGTKTIFVNGYTLPTQAALVRVEKVGIRSSVLCCAKNKYLRNTTFLRDTESVVSTLL